MNIINLLEDLKELLENDKGKEIVEKLIGELQAGNLQNKEDVYNFLSHPIIKTNEKIEEKKSKFNSEIDRL